MIPQEMKDWATRAPVAQTLQTVRQTCPRTTATCAYLFAQVPFSGKVKPTRTSPVNQRVETTVVTVAGDTSKNDKLRVAWDGMGNTRAYRANTANRAPNMLTHHGHVRVLVCTSSILWENQTNPYQSSQTTSQNNSGDGRR